MTMYKSNILANIQNRFLHWRINWEHETLRSTYEICICITATLLALLESDGNLIFTISAFFAATLSVISISTNMGLGVFYPTPHSLSMLDQGRFFIANSIFMVFSLCKAFKASNNFLSLAIVIPSLLALTCLTELFVNYQGMSSLSKSDDFDVKVPLYTKWSIVKSVSQCLLGRNTGKKSYLGVVSMKDVEEMTSHASQDRELMFKKAAKGRIVSEMIEGKKWVVLEGYVFDVEKFAEYHPGGTELLLDYADRQADITDQFAAFHNPVIYRRLLTMIVGKLELESEIRGSKYAEKRTKGASQDYRKLTAYLWSRGYFDGAEADEESARITLYRHLGILCLGILAVSQTIILQKSMKNGGKFVNYVQCALAAFTLGIFLQQSAFLAHDACHNGVVNRTKEGRSKYRKIVPNNILGWFHGTVLFGISSARWIDDHSVHHAITMRPFMDAQFKYLPIWCVSRKEFSTKIWNDMCRDFPPLVFLTKCLLCVQHYTFIPLAVVVGRFNFYIINFLYSLQNQIFFDLVGMFFYWSGYLSLLSLLREDFWLQLTFTLISHVTVGILHVQLLVSHLATDAFTPEEEEDMGYFVFQMRTTRNIDSTKNWDWFHGGLQYQIEHHLFPQLPRHRLPLVKPVLLEICSRHGIRYESVESLESVRLCLENFREIASEVWNGDITVA